VLRFVFNASPPFLFTGIHITRLGAA